ncbi:MAG: pseudaminic acid synthase [Bacteroidota bacterium]
MDAFQIGPARLGPEAPPFIVAELSGNHNGSLERALALVDAAADTGAHAIKLQTYTADTMTLDISEGEFVITDADSLWHGRNLYDLYAEAMTPWEWHAPLFERARARGMAAFSSPFDATAVDFLETLDVPAYKIASMENTDWPLLKRVARTGKPVIMSTGVSSLADVAASVEVLRANGCQHLILLKCTSSYPAPPETANLCTIPHLAQAFGCLSGLSDHTLGIGTAIAAVALGAAMIEKHFTLARADGGVDSAFSLEPAEFQTLVTECDRAWRSVGQVQYGTQSEEHTAKGHKRSIYAARDIAAGEAYTPENIRVIRPANGLPPRHYERLLGKTASRDIALGTPLSWDLIL